MRKGEGEPGTFQEVPVSDENKAYEVCRSIEGVSELSPARDVAFYRDFFARESRLDLYRNSFAYHLQATRGKPLRYYDGTSLISLGVGRDGKPLVAVGPMGESAPARVKMIAERCKAQGLPFFVKKVTPEESEQYRELGFQPVDFQHDFNSETMPDDVFPEVVIDLPEFSYEAPGPKYGHLRQRVRKLYQPDFKGSVHPLLEVTPPIQDQIREFVERWAVQKAQRLGEADSADSFSKPYAEMLENMDLLSPTKTVILAEDASGKIMGVMLADEISPDGVGVVMNLADVDQKGLAEAMMMTMAYSLKPGSPFARNRSYLNLGGSETEALHTFKTKFQPHHEIQMAYLKYTG